MEMNSFLIGSKVVAIKMIVFFNKMSSALKEMNAFHIKTNPCLMNL